VKLFVESAVAGHKLERPWLGAKLDAVTRDYAEALKLDRVAGALVVKVYTHSPAAEGGLQPGDVIVGVDGYEVADARAIFYRLTTRGIGNRAKLDIIRKGQAVSVEVTLRTAPKVGPDDVRNLAGVHPLDGARVINILPGSAEELGLSQEDGVAVLSVRPGSAAARLGLRTGDIIAQVGREKIDNVAALEKVLKDRQRVWVIAVKRGNQVVQLQVAG
jgi:S1-C subfamily serine protease